MCKDICKALLVLAASSVLVFQPLYTKAQASEKSDLPRSVVIVRHAETVTEPVDPRLTSEGALGARPADQRGGTP